MLCSLLSNTQNTSNNQTLMTKKWLKILASYQPPSERNQIEGQTEHYYGNYFDFHWFEWITPTFGGPIFLYNDHCKKIAGHCHGNGICASNSNHCARTPFTYHNWNSLQLELYMQVIDGYTLPETLKFYLHEELFFSQHKPCLFCPMIYMLFSYLLLRAAVSLAEWCERC